MKKPDPQTTDGNSENPSSDLTHRLERYRTRVAAEGRRRSLTVIDRAIKDAEGSAAKA
jgi:hypothetical protein